MPNKIIEKRGPFDVVNREVVYENHWLRLEKDEVFNRETSKEGEFGVVRYAQGAVAVLPIDDSGCVHLLKEFKYAVNDTLVQVPGGFIDEGEDALKAAKRELCEELGITASEWKYCGKIFSYGSVNEAFTELFIAHDLTFGEQNLDDNESIEKVVIPLKEAYDLVENNEISMAPCVVLIQRAMLNEGIC